MLPDPKYLANFIRRTLFQSKEERRNEDELNRDVQLRLGKVRLRRHLNHQTEILARLTHLAKRALAIDDLTRFRHVGRQILWTQADIHRWEQYLLSLEVLEARRDQVRASVDLIQAIRAMSASLAKLTGPQPVAEMQREVEQGLARAASLEERMAVMMDVLDTTLASESLSDEADLEKLQQSMSDEVTREEVTAFDREIEEGLQKIRAELEKPEG